MGKEPEPVPEPEPETPEKPEKQVNAGPIVVTLLMILAAVGAACYLKFFKKKPDVTGSADLDDYDYGDEEGEDGLENEEPEDDGK